MHLSLPFLLLHLQCTHTVVVFTCCIIRRHHHPHRTFYSKCFTRMTASECLPLFSFFLFLLFMFISSSVFSCRITAATPSCIDASIITPSVSSSLFNQADWVCMLIVYVCDLPTELLLLPAVDDVSCCCCCQLRSIGCRTMRASELLTD